MSERKPKTWTVELSSKELNYIEMALHNRIADFTFGPLAGLGNVPHLLRFTKKIYRKMRAVRGFAGTVDFPRRSQADDR